MSYIWEVNSLRKALIDKGKNNKNYPHTSYYRYYKNILQIIFKLIPTYKDKGRLGGGDSSSQSGPICSDPSYILVVMKNISKSTDSS